MYDGGQHANGGWGMSRWARAGCGGSPYDNVGVRHRLAVGAVCVVERWVGMC